MNDSIHDEVGRFRQVLVGLMALFIALVLVVLIVWYVSEFPEFERPIGLGICLFCGLMTFFFLLPVSFMLLTGRKREGGGLFSPLAIFLGGLFFAAMSVVGFTADLEDPTLRQRLAPYAFGLLALSSFTLAAGRMKVRRRRREGKDYLKDVLEDR